MHVGVGSGNPVKRRAVEAVLDAGTDEFGATATVEAIDVPSGVPEQPRGYAETMRGAENRGRAVCEHGDFDLGVGIEGGVARFESLDDGLYLIMCAAVTDGERVGRAMGPSLPLPTAVARRVDDGEELGPVMDDLLGTRGIARGQGAAGVFSGGRIDREATLSQAVAGALGPFVCELYD